jgi:hypothetical protein
VVLALAVLSSGSAFAGRESAVSPKIGRSLVVGGIEPCSGLPPRMVHGLPRFAAGTVVVLQGRERWGHLPHGPRRLILPKHVVAEQTVKVNRTYRFALFPGYYVLTARLPHSTERPFTQIVVKEGVTTHANIPNMCK